MHLNLEDAIKEACGIVGMAYHSIGDYSHPSDGFCRECVGRGLSYQNAGVALEYVRRAVIEKLQRDGFTVRENP